MTIKNKICLSLVIIFISNLLGNSVSAVSALPTGGNSFGTAVALQPGVYQGGALGENQEIYYSFQGKAGQQIKIKFSSESYSTMTLYDENKEELVDDIEISWLANADDALPRYIKLFNESPVDSFSFEISIKNYYDVGSQTDAGESFEKALTITTGDYDGYLAAHPFITELVGNDLKDYYKISVSKGVTYEFKAMPPTGGAMKLETFNLNRELLEEKSSANEGAVAALSLIPINNTYVYLAVSSDNWYGYIEKSADALNYKLSIKTSIPLSKFYDCKGDNCELAGEFSSKEACQVATTKTCYQTVNCDGKCGETPPPSSTTLPPYQDECNLNQTKCFDNFNYQKCDNYDKDEYLEWSTPVYCGEGNKCDGGKCVKAKGCQCSTWLNEECAGNDCQESEMYQTRVCEPKNCDKEKQCLTDATCKTIIECSKNSDCPKGFICKTGECVIKGGGEGGWFSLIGLGGLFISWYFWLYLILWVALYIYLALCLQILAEKTNTPNSWLAWIPIADIFLMLQIAQKPLWWFLLFLIPIVNIVIGIIIWMKIAERTGKPSWLGVLLIVPVIGIAIPGYLAFSGGEKIEPIQPYSSIGTEAANKPTVGYKHPCKYCGKLIPPNSAVCPLCGKTNPQGPYRCPKCHEPIEKNWQACSHCGQNLRIMCPKCGKITFFGDYCEDCNARLLVTCPHCNQEQPPLGDKCIKCDQPLETKK